MRTTAFLGAGCWLLALVITYPTWPTALLLLAAFVLVPLGLSLVNTDSVPAKTWSSASNLLMTPAAILLAVACALAPGALAAWLSTPWFLVTLLIACLGLRRLLAAATLADATVALGLLYLPVGGAWTILSRLGARPLDFSDAIMGATAVHFHYAGFVLPILTGLAAKRLPGPSARLACAGVALGVPLVAAGITLSVFSSTVFEAAAAWLLAASCWLVAVRQLHVASGAPRLAAWLLAVSAAALVVGMGSASLYAWGRLIHIELLTIPLMYRVHGAVNALGFALPGLLGWLLLDRSRTESVPVREYSFEEVLS